MKRYWWLLIIPLILLTGYLFLRFWNRDVVSVKAAAISRGAIEEVISASGSVNAPVYELDSKLGGKIANLRVKEGDRVYQGEVLAELDNTARLVSPGTGIVAKINYVAGETVPPGFPAIVVVNYDQSWVEAQIDEIDVANIKIGDRARITSDVYPEKIFLGEVFWITPLAELRKVGGRVKLDEESYVFPGKIKFLGSHAELKTNMSVNVEIVTRRKDSALLVPREALVSFDDTLTVFKLKNNRASQVKIETGLRSFASVEATGGIAEGDLVAVSNVSKLKNRGRVKIER